MAILSQKMLDVQQKGPDLGLFSYFLVVADIRTRIEPARQIGFVLDITEDIHARAFMKPEVQMLPLPIGFRAISGP
jgi:hypothetical protein